MHRLLGLPWITDISILSLHACYFVIRLLVAKCYILVGWTVLNCFIILLFSMIKHKSNPSITLINTVSIDFIAIFCREIWARVFFYRNVFFFVFFTIITIMHMFLFFYCTLSVFHLLSCIVFGLFPHFAIYLTCFINLSILTCIMSLWLAINN